MGGSKAKPVQTPFQQQQQQQNTFSLLGPGGTQEAKDFLGAPLEFGQGNQLYSGDAYKDVRTNFDVDPGVGRRTDLAEQANQNRWNSAFMGGIPQEYRQLQRDSESRQIRSQGAAEAQQARYANQQGEAAATLQRAQMRDASELARANMANEAGAQRTVANLGRYERLLPQIIQTGGSGSSSGYNTQLTQPTPSIWNSIIGGASQVGAAAVPFI